MRINRYVALATGLSRRYADKLLASGRVTIGGLVAKPGMSVKGQLIKLDDKELSLPAESPALVMLNKPTGYVCSRRGQGNKTIYELLPKKYASLKPVGRLDKNSSGLLLLTNDGQLANRLMHPSSGKIKIYNVRLNKPLSDTDKQRIGQGVELEDGLSKLAIKPAQKYDDRHIFVTMSEGRNRQIRRTFGALGYEITKLHRTGFGPYNLSGLKPGQNKEIIVK